MKDSLTMLIVGCHRDKKLVYNPPQKPWERFIQAGAALTDSRIYPLNDHDGFEASISGRNRRYCEMTAIFWARHNISTPYIGIEHYRRRFIISDEELAAALSGGTDLITLTEHEYPDSLENTAKFTDFSLPYDLSMEILEKHHPEYMPLAAQLSAGNRMHAGNMNIWKRDLFYEYCDWLFPMLDDFYREVPEKRDAYLHRDVGFFAERATSLFVESLERGGLKIKRCRPGMLECMPETPEKEKRSGSDDPDEAAFAQIEELFAQNRLIECRNTAITSYWNCSSAESRSRLDSYIKAFELYDRERRFCPLSFFEYLPPVFTSSMKKTGDCLNALKLSLEQLFSDPTPENEELLASLVTNMRFSGAAIHYMLKKHFDRGELYEYTAAVLTDHGLGETAQLLLSI